MSRYDLRWMRRHPLKWLRIMWFPWALAALLAANAFVVTQPVFAVTTAAPVWPIILAFTAGVLGLSAFDPLDTRVQAAAAAWLFGVSLLRAATYLDTAVRADLSASALAVAFTLAIHWAMLATVAAKWPSLVGEPGRRVTVEAGRDDRGVA